MLKWTVLMFAIMAVILASGCIIVHNSVQSPDAKSDTALESKVNADTSIDPNLTKQLEGK